jgi:hypothetical protein
MWKDFSSVTKLSRLLLSSQLAPYQKNTTFYKMAEIQFIKNHPSLATKEKGRELLPSGSVSKPCRDVRTGWPKALSRLNEHFCFPSFCAHLLYAV